MIPFRIGSGYDIHRLVSGRKLILGGIAIEHNLGLEGHSDADCLSHAIADAILGAAALPDIGHHFPDTDPRYKDMDSQLILTKSIEAINALGFTLVNIDATVIAEAPKIGPHIDAIKSKLSKSLGVPATHIGIKATTNESVDAIGKREAIATHAVALICKTVGQGERYSQP